MAEASRIIDISVCVRPEHGISDNPASTIVTKLGREGPTGRERGMRRKERKKAGFVSFVSWLEGVGGLIVADDTWGLSEKYPEAV